MSDGVSPLRKGGGAEPARPPSKSATDCCPVSLSPSWCVAQMTADQLITWYRNNEFISCMRSLFFSFVLDVDMLFISK